jgi:hypothetical protein
MTLATRPKVVTPSLVLPLSPTSPSALALTAPSYPGNLSTLLQSVRSASVASNLILGLVSPSEATSSSKPNSSSSTVLPLLVLASPRNRRRWSTFRDVRDGLSKLRPTLSLNQSFIYMYRALTFINATRKFTIHYRVTFSSLHNVSERYMRMQERLTCCNKHQQPIHQIWWPWRHGLVPWVCFLRWATHLELC